MTTKVIKTDEEYAAALEVLERLIDQDPAPQSDDADRLELLTLLIQNFESKKVATVPPTPIEAVRFRMDQQGLIQRDLVPYIGSRSRVSEVLSGKRPLTLRMIRALHNGLGIPAKALLGELDTTILEESQTEWDRFPILDMVKRGWIKASASDVRDRAEELMRAFLERLGPQQTIAALYKRSSHVRSGRTLNMHGLMAWTIQVLIRANEDPPQAAYSPETVTPDFMREVTQLSWSDTGPKLAQEYLEKHGIKMVVEPHLPKTQLDGAAILHELSFPVIGLSLRYDRIDNFWFCLMHELAHIALHDNEESDSFYDDLDAAPEQDHREKATDDLAEEALIPREVWENSPAKSLCSPEAAQHLASELGIHPAIVAGRMRYETRRYKILSHMVGHGEVRKLFPAVEWSPREVPA